MLGAAATALLELACSNHCRQRVLQVQLSQRLLLLPLHWDIELQREPCSSWSLTWTLARALSLATAAPLPATGTVWDETGRTLLGRAA